MSSLENIRASVIHRLDNVRIWQQIRRFWSGISPLIRRTALVLWTTGPVLLALGIWGDSAGFWTAKPFLTNTFSAFTGAMFGIPVALIVLQRIAASEADAAAARSARHLAARVSTDLAAAAASLVENDISRINTAIEFLESQVAMFRSNAASDSYLVILPGNVGQQPYIDAIESAWACFGAVLSPDQSVFCAEVISQWSMLNTEARLEYWELAANG